LENAVAEKREKQVFNSYANWRNTDMQQKKMKCFFRPLEVLQSVSKAREDLIRHKSHLLNSKYKYLSPKVQNKRIQQCEIEIRKTIRQRCEQFHFDFSVMTFQRRHNCPFAFVTGY
jgi:hypothetical protein